MRYTPLLLSALLALAPLSHADEPQYHNDRAIKAQIQAQATKLTEAEKTVANKTLQQQLAERAIYDAAPPKPTKLTEGGKDLVDAVDDGIIVVSRIYLCGKCDKLHSSDASGFVISEDGLAVTNYHVMENKDEKTQTFVARTLDGRVVPIVDISARLLAAAMKQSS